VAVSLMFTFLLECLALICLAGVGAIGALFTRRVVIRRRGGTFDCSLRLTPGSARAAVHFGGGGRPGTVVVDRVAIPDRGNRAPLSAYGVRAGRGWAYGIAQYEADRIDWFRIFSYAYRPAAVLTRRDLEVLARREADGEDELALFPGWTIVECRFGTGLVELAMAPDALTGFLSWLEAAPPGQNVSMVS
jgi:hypothetical protein